MTEIEAVMIGVVVMIDEAVMTGVVVMKDEAVMTDVAVMTDAIIEDQSRIQILRMIGYVGNVETQTSHFEQNVTDVVLQKVEVMPLQTNGKAMTEDQTTDVVVMTDVVVTTDVIIAGLSKIHIRKMIGLVVNVETQTSHLEQNVTDVVHQKEEERLLQETGKAMTEDQVTEGKSNNQELETGNAHSVENLTLQNEMNASDVVAQRELVGQSREVIIAN